MHQDETIKRLQSIEGHVHGIKNMVENGAYCVDVIRQIQAVQAALNKVSLLVLDHHLNSCVVTAVRGESEAERERVLQEIAQLFETATKV